MQENKYNETRQVNSSYLLCLDFVVILYAVTGVPPNVLVEVVALCGYRFQKLGSM